MWTQQTHMESVMNSSFDEFLRQFQLIIGRLGKCSSDFIWSNKPRQQLLCPAFWQVQIFRRQIYSVALNNLRLFSSMLISIVPLYHAASYECIMSICEISQCRLRERTHSWRCCLSSVDIGHHGRHICPVQFERCESCRFANACINRKLGHGYFPDPVLLVRANCRSEYLANRAIRSFCHSIRCRMERCRH